jgi:opacity protein-like surface antigen
MKVMRQLNRLAAGTAVAAIAAVAGAGLAQADGMPGKRVAYEKPWDWGGLYFGVHSGYQWSSVNVENPAFPPGFSFDHDSMVVGGQIGLQHQFGQIVVGVEGNLTTTYQNNPGSTTCFAPGPQLTPGGLGNCSARLDDILTIGPRLGFAMGKWMPYITGGYANGAYHFYGRTIGTQIQNEEARARLSGWFIGAGVDMALSHGWTVGLDYRHYDFGENIVPAFNPAGLFLEPARFSDATADVVTLRVSWKLGRPDRVSPLK